MHLKALVAFATVLVMVLAAFPLGNVESTPSESDYNIGFFWESNDLNKDKIMEIYGEEGTEIATAMLDSMFITDYDYWDWSLIICDVKESDAIAYSTFSYDDNKGYHEVEMRTISDVYGHVKFSFTPAKESIGKSLFRLGKAEVTGDLKSVIEEAKILEGMELIVDCNINFIESFEKDVTYIKNKNGKFIANSDSTDYSCYMEFKDAKIVCKVDGEDHEFKMDLYDCTYFDYVTMYYSANDPEEKGMEEIGIGDEIRAVSVIHNVWDNWHATISQGDKKALITSNADSIRTKAYSGTVSDDLFVSLSELKSLSTIYESWYCGMGGDVNKTESFLKSNGHFEKGYECGKFYFNAMMNVLMEEDEAYSDYVKDHLKDGSSNSNNTMLYAVSAIAVILLIVSIALAVMYKKKTA